MSAIDAFVRLLGAEPDRVRPLARGLALAARGRLALLGDRQEIGVSPELVPILAGFGLSLGSVVLALLVVALRAKVGIALTVVAAGHAAGTLLIAGTGVPSLLQDDDLLVVGWWPLTARDRAVARLLAMLRPVLRGGALLASLPLLAVAVVGPIPVVSALLLAAGLLLQALALTTGLVALASGAARRLGHRRARALLAGLVAFGFAGAWGVSFWAERHVRDAAALERLLQAAPPAWFAAWGRLPGDASAILPAAAALSLSLLLAPLALRVLGAAGGAERREIARAATARSPLSALAGLMVRATTRGREGRAMRLLLTAHVRDDWHAAALAAMPMLGAIAAALVVALPASIAEHAAGASAEMPLRPVLGASVLAVYAALAGVLALSGSTSPQSIWLVATSDLDPSKLALATIGAARALLAVPLVVVLLAVHARAGSPWTTALPDACVAWLLFEIASALLHLRRRAWPFSKPWDDPPDDVTLAMAAGALPLSAMLLLAMVLLYDHGAATRLGTCAILGAALIAARRELVRACRRDGLRLEMAPPP